MLIYSIMTVVQESVRVMEYTIQVLLKNMDQFTSLLRPRLRGQVRILPQTIHHPDIRETLIQLLQKGRIQ